MLALPAIRQASGVSTYGDTDTGDLVYVAPVAGPFVVAARSYDLGEAGHHVALELAFGPAATDGERARAAHGASRWLTVPWPPTAVCLWAPGEHGGVVVGRGTTSGLGNHMSAISCTLPAGAAPRFLAVAAWLECPAVWTGPALRAALRPRARGELAEAVEKAREKGATWGRALMDGLRHAIRRGKGHLECAGGRSVSAETADAVVAQWAFELASAVGIAPAHLATPMDGVLTTQSALPESFGLQWPPNTHITWRTLRECVIEDTPK